MTQLHKETLCSKSVNGIDTGRYINIATYVYVLDLHLVNQYDSCFLFSFIYFPFLISENVVLLQGDNVHHSYFFTSSKFYSDISVTLTQPTDNTGITVVPACQSGQYQHSQLL